MKRSQPLLLRRRSAPLGTSPPETESTRSHQIGIARGMRAMLVPPIPKRMPSSIIGIPFKCPKQRILAKPSLDTNPVFQARLFQRSSMKKNHAQQKQQRRRLWAAATLLASHSSQAAENSFNALRRSPSRTKSEIQGSFRVCLGATTTTRGSKTTRPVWRPATKKQTLMDQQLLRPRMPSDHHCLSGRFFELLRHPRLCRKRIRSSKGFRVFPRVWIQTRSFVKSALAPFCNARIRARVCWQRTGLLKPT